MTWNTKRDGYYQHPANLNPLGRPVPGLEPHAGHSHAIVIPGTTFKMFFSDAFTAKNKVEGMLKYLARTTVSGTGKRRAKAAPVLMTIEEFQSLNSAKAA